MARATNEPAAASAASEPDRVLEKVSMSDLPKPNPKAMKALNRHQTKVGWNKLIVDSLESTSFTIIGDDNDLNWAVAEALGSRIGWFPVNTKKVVAGLLKAPSPDALQGPEYKDKLAAAEASVLRGLRNQKRVVAATLPGGAASQAAVYADLWGSFIIHVDEEDPSSPKPQTSERQLHQQHAEISVKIRKTRGFADANATPDQKAREHLDALLTDLTKQLNSSNLAVVEKKKKYVELGCRGDWPELKPADWTPGAAA